MTIPETDRFHQTLQRLRPERLDHQDHLVWAFEPARQEEKIRLFAPQLGLDPSLLITGSVLYHITGDDANPLCYQFIRGDQAQVCQKQLVIRLNWESSLPELPQNIKDQIEVVKPKLIELDWTDPSQFQAAHSIWTEEVHNFTKREIALYPPYQKAIDYYLQKWEA